MRGIACIGWNGVPNPRCRYVMYIISAETINNILTRRDRLCAWHRMHWLEWSTQPPMQVCHVYNICRDNKQCINTEGSFVCVVSHALARMEYPTPDAGMSCI